MDEATHRAALPEGRTRIRAGSLRHHGPDDRRLRHGRARNASGLPRPIRSSLSRSIPRELRVVIVNSMVQPRTHRRRIRPAPQPVRGGRRLFRRTQPGRHEPCATSDARTGRGRRGKAARRGFPSLPARRHRKHPHRPLPPTNLPPAHYEEVGELMVQSHNSLRDDYEVSCAGARFPGRAGDEGQGRLRRPHDRRRLRRLHRRPRSAARPSIALTGHLRTPYTREIRQRLPPSTSPRPPPGHPRSSKSIDPCNKAARRVVIDSLRDILLKLCRREDLTRDRSARGVLA